MNTPNCLPLSIGSFPYKKPGTALDKILEFFPEIPAWPQLPQISIEEQIYVQFCEGIPCLKIDKKQGRLSFDENDENFFNELASTLEQVIEKNYDYFAIKENYARGLYRFIERTPQIQSLRPSWIKGQIAGPVSFSLSIMDKNLKPALYNETYRQVIEEALKMKAVWQIKTLQKIHPHVILFIDEPYLASFGSSMLALSRDEALSMISGIVEAVKEANASAAIHCCGNTDWSILMDSGCDIISMDAYLYGDNFALYREKAANFIRNGGKIAWGIVPTSAEAENETAESLWRLIENLIEKFEEGDLSTKKILEHSFITPSCGFGTLSYEISERIMTLTRQLSRQIREKFEIG